MVYASLSGGVTPRTPHPTPYTLHPTPYTLHPTPYTPHAKHYTPHPTPYNLNPTPYTLHPTPYNLHPTPYPRLCTASRRSDGEQHECLKGRSTGGETPVTSLHYVQHTWSKVAVALPPPPQVSSTLSV